MSVKRKARPCQHKNTLRDLRHWLDVDAIFIKQAKGHKFPREPEPLLGLRLLGLDD